MAYKFIECFKLAHTREDKDNTFMKMSCEKQLLIKKN